MACASSSSRSTAARYVGALDSGDVQDPAGASASVAIAAHLGRSRSAQCYLFNEADYTAAQRVGVEPLERFDEPEPIVACNELGDVIRR